MSSWELLITWTYLAACIGACYAVYRVIKLVIVRMAVLFAGLFGWSAGGKPDGLTDQERRDLAEEIKGYRRDWRLLLVACAAKFAKTDGVVTKGELAVVEELFGYLDLTGKMRQEAITVFNQAKVGRATLGTTLHYCVTQRWWQSSWSNNALLLFFKLAYADGQPNARTQQRLEAICGWLKEDCQECRREYEEGRREAVARQPDGLGAAYVVLGCEPGDALHIVKERYRKLVKDFHPDTVMSKGLPADFVRFAEERFKQIQAAYETVMQARGATAV